MSSSIDKLRHVRQRFAAPSRGASALVHVAGLVAFITAYKEMFEMDNIVTQSYGNHYQYLTILGLFVSVVAFSFGILADLTLSPLLFKIKNTLTVVGLPLEILISLMYWGLKSIDPKLVVPDWAAPSLSLDIRLHAAPAILLAIDHLLFSPPWTIAAVPAIILSLTEAIGYWFWVEQCYSKNGWYPYPLFDQLEVQQRGLLFAGNSIFLALATLGIKWFYSKLNAARTQAKRKKRN